MSLKQLKNTLLIALVYMFRMLGLFMVIPTLSLAWQKPDNVSTFQIGLAIGAYGFSQACLQIFLGWLSDIYNRKSIIIIGLLLFCSGSLIAAYSDNIQSVIVGRFLQGSGAIAGALSALLADLTAEEHLSKAMAIVGMAIGLSFILAMFLGPLVYSAFGLYGIFLSNAIMAIFAIMLIIGFISTPIEKSSSKKKLSELLKDTVKIVNNKSLNIHFIGVFFLHFVLMAIFVIVPILLTSLAGISSKNHGFVYLIINLLAFFISLALIFYGEKYKKIKNTYLIGIFTIMCSVFFMFALKEARFFLIGLFLFFCGFNFLEATLPSLVSKLSPLLNRGTTMGIYATCQFMGAALGSSISGWLIKIYDVSVLFLLCGLVLLLWCCIAKKMKHPRNIKSIVIIINEKLSLKTENILAKINSISGVLEAVTLQQGNKAYVKVDKDKFDADKLGRFGKII